MNVFAWGRVKGYCRTLAFARFMGDTRELLSARPEDELARARALAALRSVLGELNDEERRLLELRYWQDLSCPEVAEAMRVHYKYAQRLDERLRERLKRGLRKRGVHGAPAL